MNGATLEGVFTTAHEAWDRRWRSAHHRAQWSAAEPAVARVAELLRERSARRVVDIGCGVGRHALLFAQEGFDVAAIDASRSGIDEVGRSAREAGVEIELHVGQFTALPYETGAFDYALAWNVLYHGDVEVVRAAFAECRRVVRPGGLFQFTMLSKRNAGYGRGREVRPGTFVVDESEGDKAHPHFYVDDVDLTRLLREAGFALWELEDVDQKPPSRAQHWVGLAEVCPSALT